MICIRLEVGALVDLRQIKNLIKLETFNQLNSKEDSFCLHSRQNLLLLVELNLVIPGKTTFPRNEINKTTLGEPHEETFYC